MSNVDTTLRDLLLQAGDPDKTLRSDLFLCLAEILVEDGSPADEGDEAGLGGLLVSLLPHVEKDIRRKLAFEVSRLERPPVVLVAALASDVGDIARDVVEAAPLSEQQWLQVLKYMPVERWGMVERRQDLPSAVQDLISRHIRRPSPLPTRDPALVRLLPKDDEWKQLFEKKRELPTILADSPVHEETEPMLQMPTAEPDLRTEATAAKPISTERPGVNGWTFVTDRAGNIIELSEEAAEQSGVTSEALSRASLFSLFEGEPDATGMDALVAAFDRHSPMRAIGVELIFGEKTGSRWVLTGTAKFDPADGRFSGYQGQVTFKNGGGNEAAPRQSTVETPAPSPAPLLIRKLTETTPDRPEDTQRKQPKAAPVTKSPLPIPPAVSASSPPVFGGAAFPAANAVRLIAQGAELPLESIIELAERSVQLAHIMTPKNMREAAGEVSGACYRLRTLLVDVAAAYDLMDPDKQPTARDVDLTTLLGSAMEAWNSQGTGRTGAFVFDTAEAAVRVHFNGAVLSRCVQRMLTAVVETKAARRQRRLHIRRKNDLVQVLVPFPGKLLAARALFYSANEISELLQQDGEAAGSPDIRFSLSVARQLAKRLGGDMKAIEDKQGRCYLCLSLKLATEE